MLKGNLFADIPDRFDREIFQTLFARPGVSIQRILSKGQTTDWLAQDADEWVVLMFGAAKILLEEGNQEVSMRPGDYVHIPAGCRHRVSWTDPARKSVWLAVHFKQ